VATSLRRRWSALILLAALLTVVGGCGATGTTDAPEEVARQAACQALTDLEGSITSFRILVPATTDLETYRIGLTTISEDWDTLKLALGDLLAAEQAAVDAEIADVRAAVDAVPADAPTEEKLQPIVDAGEDVEAAFNDLRDGLDCR
jgi:prophage DNA circulation protein